MGNHGWETLVTLQGQRWETREKLGQLWRFPVFIDIQVMAKFGQLWMGNTGKAWGRMDGKL